MFELSHLTRSRNQLWSDLLANLEGSGSNLTLSEAELIAAARNTYGGSISAKTTSRAALIASLVNAAGGNVSEKTHSEGHMIAALATALGGTASALSSSFEESLAIAVDETSGGGGEYTAQAIETPPGVELYQTATSAPYDKITILVWYRQTADGFASAVPILGGGSGVLITPNETETADIKVLFDGGIGGSASFASEDDAIASETFFQVFASADLNQAAGEKVFRLLVNGVDVLDPAKTNDVSGAFAITNEQPIIIPDFTGEPWPNGYADILIWYGAAHDPTGHLDKIISGGKPVDPAVTVAQFGMPDVWLSGDKDSFAANQGSGPSFAIRVAKNEVVGRNGVGPIMVADVQVGSLVTRVDYFNGSGFTDIASKFESTISVAGQIQQTAAEDLSGLTNINVTVTAFLDDCATSPSD